MQQFKGIFHRFIYGTAFVILLPSLLALWAHATDAYIRLPVPRQPLLGVALIIFGVALMAAGMYAITVYGKGLPMNAFPPENYVTKGVFAVFANPIYIGFVSILFGTSIVSDSPAGFWLVSPSAALCCAALVLGYEQHDLATRFGSLVRRPYISIPEESAETAGFRDRLSVYILVLLPWTAVYSAFITIGTPPDAISSYLPFEEKLSVWEWSEAIYAATYLFVPFVLFIPVSKKTLREYSIAALTATVVIALFFIAIPFTASPRPFTAQGYLGELLNFERGSDTPWAAFPSFHAVWAVIAARAYSRTYPRLRHIFSLFALMIAASCVTTGMHSVADVAAGLFAGIAFINYQRIWELMRSASEFIANSWREWRFGPLRIINHGAYTGLGAGLGLFIVGLLLGNGALGYALIMAFASLITAGLWAQVIEGSPSLLRPYGYYGGVIGAVFGAFIVYFMGADIWPLLGAYAVAGPVVQAFGRLRCFVQGCCHGHEAPDKIGIRYTHPRSRVCRLTEFSNRPIHATQLYSIIWNIVCGVILARLWSLDVQPSMIGGLYLILNSAGRFVEEAYRGEPQTPIWGDLRLYQFMCILSVISGAVITAIPTEPVAAQAHFSIQAAIAGTIFLFVTWFAQGVDFPESNKRFSRLV